ncbi:winged helix-turn-helix domain-containing protein [Candidatus Entotheonella palauensis]|uniref:winged helix-turn-helix domain-containing protein n=1 Tax=Candidatus Entotheonella palauensis TaxID=93172 RepID=UPI000B7D78F0|nr:winged helix-turn-helix domain-containing protein [Candidatus Entotheonella palauensis]
MHFEFGGFVLDTQQHELRRAGVVRPLEPKAFRVLSYLLTHRHRVVSKHELLNHCWPGEFVTESALARCLKIIRQPVDDNGVQQHVIKTQRGIGYRFVADAISWEPAPESAETTSTQPAQIVGPVAHEEGPYPALLPPHALVVNRPTNASIASGATPSERKWVTVLVAAFHGLEQVDDVEELDEMITQPSTH